LIELPIIVLENGDLDMFASTDDVDAELEAVDVREGRYVAYDATGRRLRLGTEGRWGVAVAEDAGDVRDPDVLAGALRSYLAACRLTAPTDATLGELLRLAVDKVGYTARPPGRRRSRVPRSRSREGR